MQLKLITTIYIATLGLIFGSFLTASIYRLPLGKKKGAPSEAELRGEEVPEDEEEEELNKNISLTYPKRSFCPKCEKQLYWWHNIPFFSWLILKGRCWFCHEAIPFRYPLVELISMCFALASYYSFDLPTAILVYAYCCSLVVITFIDIEYYIIPDAISYPATAIALIVAVQNSFFPYFTWPVVDSLSSALFGVLAGSGFLLVVAEIFFRLRGKMGLGLGDIKLLLFTGLLFGPECALTSVFVGSFMGSLVGLLLMSLSNFDFAKRHSLGTPLPFGPFLAAGAIFYIFAREYNFVII